MINSKNSVFPDFLQSAHFASKQKFDFTHRAVDFVLPTAALSRQGTPLVFEEPHHYWHKERQFQIKECQTE